MTRRLAILLAPLLAPILAIAVPGGAQSLAPQDAQPAPPAARAVPQDDAAARPAPALTVDPLAQLKRAMRRVNCTRSCELSAVIVKAAKTGYCFPNVVANELYQIDEDRPFAGVEIAATARLAAPPPESAPKGEPGTADPAAITGMFGQPVTLAGRRLTLIVEVPGGAAPHLCIQQPLGLAGYDVTVDRPEDGRRRARSIGEGLMRDPVPGAASLFFGSSADRLVTVRVTARDAHLPIYLDDRPLNTTDYDFSIAVKALDRVMIVKAGKWMRIRTQCAMRGQAGVLMFEC